MTNSGIIKLVGPQWTANGSTNQPNTIPTNAAATGANTSGANAYGDYTGYGNSVPGGATFMRVLNNTGNLVTMTITNTSPLVGQVNNSIVLQAATDYFIEKYAYDTVSFANTANLNQLITANLFTSPVAIKY